MNVRKLAYAKIRQQFPGPFSVSVPSILVYMGLILVMIFTTAIVLARFAATAGLQAQTSDPFLPYEIILPGGSQESLAAFNCQHPPPPPPFEGSAGDSPDMCSIFPPHDALFHLIIVGIMDNHIQETTFFSQYLQISQLMQQWGNPQSEFRGPKNNSFTLQWDRGLYTITAVIPPPLGSTIAKSVRFTGKYHS